MSFLDNIGEAIKNQVERRRQERERIDSMRREMEAQRFLEREQQSKMTAADIAQNRILRDTSEKQGIQRLRAINRASINPDLNEGSFYNKLSDYTRKNIARREENIRKTQRLRDEARKMREQQLKERQMERDQRMKRASHFRNLR